MNSTSKTPQYKNTNPQFDSKCQSRAYGGANGCTHAGCGKECCLLPFLLEDISGVGSNGTTSIWNLPPLDMGNAFNQNTKVYAGWSNDGKKLIGTIYAAVYPYTNCCIIPGRPYSDYPGTNLPNRTAGQPGKEMFPITVRLLITPDSGICNQHRYEKGMSLFFGSSTDPLYQNPAAENKPSANIEREAPIKTGLSTIGKPYRNPIAGYRKTLVCCNPLLQCKDCILVYTVLDWPGTARPAIGDDVRDITGALIGQVIAVTHTYNEGTVTVRPIGDCDNYSVPEQGGLVIGGTQYLHIGTLTTKTDTDCTKLGATNDIYKDNFAKSCQSDARACYDRRIRSGMQPKQQVCVEYTKTKDGYKKHKRMLCPKDLGFHKKYNYSYAQYLQNGSNKSFARSQEKYLPNPFDISSNCPSNNQCHSTTPCCQNSLYRKSGGNACATCCQEQRVELNPDSQSQPNVGDPVYNLQTNNNGTFIGTVASFYLQTQSPQRYIIHIRLVDCNKRVDKRPPGIRIGQTTWTPGDILNFTGIAQTSATSGMAVTIYKPSNKKFKVQGAVSSSSRMERLKLDAIRESGSKCIKGQRCKIVHGERYGKGRYLAGRPRFTGWMYNARHPETLCMRKYRQQPFGIPQLTNRRRPTRSNRLPGVHPATSTIVSGVFQRTGGNPRAPGCKCPPKRCAIPCAGTLGGAGTGQSSNVPSAIYCP